MILRAVPLIALPFGFALENRRWHLVGRASTPARAGWSRPGAAAAPGFQIHLKFAFCSAGGSVC
jgi:hypothetical protein